MNSKSKIILGLSSILAVSAGVAGASTYAWFTTSRSTSVSITNIGVKSNNGALWCSAEQSTDPNKGGMEIGTAGNSSTTPIVNGLDAKMYDVSSDGLIFYQPRFNANVIDSGTGKPTVNSTDANSSVWRVPTLTEGAVSIGTVDNQTPGNLAFREFNLTFHNGGTAGTTSTVGGSTVVVGGDSAFDVYVDTGSGNSATQIKGTTTSSNDVAAAAATRIAILNAAKTEVLFYYQGGTEANNAYYYVHANASATTKAYGVTGYELANATTTISHACLGAAPIEAVTDGKSAQQQKQLLVSGIAAGGSASVCVRIWIEGTSDHCTNGALNGNIASYLNFSAI